jgi:hypothetical protein
LGLITLAGKRKGKKRKKRKKEEKEKKTKKEKKEKKDRFLYVGIVDKKTKMELEIPVPPSLTTKLPN